MMRMNRTQSSRAGTSGCDCVHQLSGGTDVVPGTALGRVASLLGQRLYRCSLLHWRPTPMHAKSFLIHLRFKTLICLFEKGIKLTSS